MTLNNVVFALLNLLVLDVIFVCVLLAVVGLLAGTKRAAFAVMKRNFFGTSATQRATSSCASSSS